MSISRQPYQNILNEFELTIDWLNDLGISTENSRVSQYHQFMLDLTENYKALSFEESKEKFPNLISYIVDIFNFNQIHKALSGFDKGQLLSFSPIIKEAIKGPANQIDEGRKTTARNFLFEAMVAARFHLPDSGVSMIPNPITDVAVNVLNHELLIECKRISSENKFESNIKKAAKQLNNAFSKKCTSQLCGLIAVNISKLINPQDCLLLCETPEEVKNLASLKLQEFVNRKLESLAPILSKNHKVIGVLFLFNCISICDNLPIHTTEWVLYANPFSSRTGKNVLEHMEKNIASSKASGLCG